MSDLRKALEAITYASDDGLEFEHTHPADEGEPECPACWVQHIRQILAAHPEPALPRFVPSESFVVPLEDPNDPSADEQVEAEAEWDPAAALVDEWARLDAANADEDARAEGYRDGFSAAMVGALRDEAKAKAALAEKIAEIAEEAADELDLPVMGEWLDQRDWFKDQLHALAAKAREAGGVS